MKLYHKSLDNYKLPAARSLGPCLVSNALIPVSASSGLLAPKSDCFRVTVPVGEKMPQYIL